MADGSEIIVQLVERLLTMLAHKIGDQVDLVRGVKKEVADLSKKLKRVRDQLDDAEEKAIKDRNIKDWLYKLEKASYEMDDVLDEWEYAVLKLKLEGPDANSASQQKLVCSFLPSPSSCLCFKKLSTRHHVANKIKQLKQKLDKILKEGENYELVISQPKELIRRPPTTSFVEVDDIRGRNHDKKILLNKLVGDEGSSEAQSGIQIISIVGSGGIGKTTLAQLMYNDSRVTNHYPLKIWICVSDPFDRLEIAKGIIEKVGPGSCPATNDLDILLEHLKSLIMGKKFLLVLDDVWTEEPTEWEPFQVCLKYGGEGSKILVTTRKKKVAEIMGTTDSNMHHIGLLTDEECWLILRRMAFTKSRESECIRFEAIGKMIASKCKGLPLAAKVIGSVLHDKRTTEGWENILNNKIWENEEVEVNLKPHLLLSYNELSPRALKRCFSYLSFFPQDTRLEAWHIINCWLALGYLGNDDSGGELELRGQDYFHGLAMRSLLQDFQTDHVDKNLLIECKMHDIVHEFARSLRKDGSVQAICQVCSSSLISTVKEYRALVLKDDYPTYICDCLKSLRILQLIGQGGMPNGVEKLIHLRYLHLEGDVNTGVGDLKAIFKLYNLKVLVISMTNLQVIPREIGNLVRLRHLKLNRNELLKELPETICDLHELRSLDVSDCDSLCGVPHGIHKLTKLKHLNVDDGLMEWHIQVPWEAVGQLTGLRRLVGPFAGKLKHLKRLNQLNGCLHIEISRLIGEGDVVDDAREAELNKKACLQELRLEFNVEQSDDDSVWVDTLAALRPHQNLPSLCICRYGGSKLPDWIVSPLNLLRQLTLLDLAHSMLQLPALGKLPCLEYLHFGSMDKLKFVGREFLGISEDVGSPPSNLIGFPKLKELNFWMCFVWEEWEDITGEEELSTTLSLFPCLNTLVLSGCFNLKALPHRLWRKVITSSKDLFIEIIASDDVGEDLKMNILGGLNPGEGFSFSVVD